MPPADRGFAALLDDLSDARACSTRHWSSGSASSAGRRGSPTANAGREHWPRCYSAVLAGGGVAGGPGLWRLRPLGGLPRPRPGQPRRPRRDHPPRPRDRPVPAASRPPRPPLAHQPRIAARPRSSEPLPSCLQPTGFVLTVPAVPSILRRFWPGRFEGRSPGECSCD